MTRAAAVLIVWLGLWWVDAEIEGRGLFRVSSLTTSAPGTRADHATVGTVPGANFLTR